MTNLISMIFDLASFKRDVLALRARVLRVIERKETENSERSKRDREFKALSL